jgi:formylmethanofuran--tetrahydromethanopterin N-formyltransferase
MNPDIVEDTFAEAFRTYYSRILITAATPQLAETAAISSTGFATSALGCGVEAGIDRVVGADKTPDVRPGVMVQYHIWKKDPKEMYEVLLHRVGHCILTSPSAAVFDATNKPVSMIDLGMKLKYFGDGYEEVGKVGDRDVVRIPIMGGTFIIEKEVGMTRGISGGNLWFMGSSEESAIAAATAAVDAISEVPGTIMPFPGGLCSSGSKVGAVKYKFMANSTNHLYCPSLRERVEGSKVPVGVSSIIEIVINGTTTKSVGRAMGAGIEAASGTEGLILISAGNFGGKLGKFNIHLKNL